VYHLVPRLAERPTKEAAVGESDGYAMVSQEESVTDGDAPAPRARVSPGVLSMLRQIFPWSSIVLYAKHKAFLPSLAYAFLHLTVLSFSGRMIAFLLAVGYTSLAVGVARTVSTVAELSATWISPMLMKRLGRVRSGGASIIWEAAWLSLGVGCFMVGGKVALIGLVAGVILSRIGLWGVDLAVQNIVQNVSVAYTWSSLLFADLKHY
jgi:iron-regulated transporter 1